MSTCTSRKSMDYSQIVCAGVDICSKRRNSSDFVCLLSPSRKWILVGCLSILTHIIDDRKYPPLCSVAVTVCQTSMTTVTLKADGERDLCADRTGGPFGFTEAKAMQIIETTDYK